MKNIMQDLGWKYYDGPGHILRCPKVPKEVDLDIDGICILVIQGALSDVLNLGDPELMRIRESCKAIAMELLKEREECQFICFSQHPQVFKFREWALSEKRVDQLQIKMKEMMSLRLMSEKRVDVIFKETKKDGE
tara:strand:+ start:148 stop:552 length:405 start_codon:yes stop_codon:yes gene_type:complete